jgi:hypothetical protein
MGVPEDEPVLAEEVWEDEWPPAAEELPDAPQHYAFASCRWWIRLSPEPPPGRSSGAFA